MNIYKYHFPRLNQGPKVHIYKFWGLIRQLHGFWGVFIVIPMWGQFILGGSPKAQLIMHCLQHELWHSVSTMQWVKSANSRKRVDE